MKDTNGWRKQVTVSPTFRRIHLLQRYINSLKVYTPKRWRYSHCYLFSSPIRVFNKVLSFISWFLSSFFCTRIIADDSKLSRTPITLSFIFWNIRCNTAEIQQVKERHASTLTIFTPSVFLLFIIFFTPCLSLQMSSPCTFLGVLCSSCPSHFGEEDDERSCGMVWRSLCLAPEVRVNPFRFFSTVQPLPKVKWTF